MKFRMLFLALCILRFGAGLAAAQAPADVPAPKPVVETAPNAADSAATPWASNSDALAASDRFWAYADYGIAFFSPASLPPLATTAPAGTARVAAGVLGVPGTTILYSGYKDDALRSSFQLGGGFWLNSAQTLGVEAGFMMVESQSSLFFAASNGSTILARPFFNVGAAGPQAVLVAFPGSSAGSLDIRAGSGNLYGGNLDFIGKTYDIGWFQLNSLFGYRYYGYDEDLGIQQIILPSSPVFIPGTRVVSDDSFRTRNRFNGVDIGFRGEFLLNSISIDLLARVALGNLQSGIDINGSQTTTVPGSRPVISSGGVNALISNIGAYEAHRLEAWPEFGATLKWQVNSFLQLRLGYSIMLLEGVVRAGNEIDQGINTANFAPATAVATPPRPTYIFNRSDVFVQTFNVGMVFSY